MIFSENGEPTRLKRESSDRQKKKINRGLPTCMLKELGANWLLQMAEYFAKKPQIIVVRQGIASGLDHSLNELEVNRTQTMKQKATSE